MDIMIHPGKLSGSLSVIPSKSQAHRFLICGAFADGPTQLLCPEVNRDMEATAACLNAIGADIQRTLYGYRIEPVQRIPETAILPCQDSGSTLRFLLPIVGALGIDALFNLEGRLAQRPLSPLWEEMIRMGCSLSYTSDNQLHCSGKLRNGVYQIDGSISSQFITGLLFACALIPGENKIIITGKTESKSYIDMTQQVMTLFGCTIKNYTVTGGNKLHTPGTVTVEGDWSNGAFFLAANALGSSIEINNLSPNSLQGDRAITSLLPMLKNHCSISAAHIPDLIPALSIVASCNHGAVFTDIQRLRYKESDRVESIISMISSLGGKAEATESTLTVYGGGLLGGTVNCMNDHRITMAAAIGATVCKDSVILLGVECADKSYPNFFEEYSRLGGHYEQFFW